MSGPTLADLYMAVRAFEAGIKANAATLDAQLDQLRDDLGLDKANFKTPYGLLVGTTVDEHIEFDHDGLLEWARVYAEHEVVPEWDEEVIIHHDATVRPSLAKWLQARCEVSDDGSVIDTATGETLGFARAVPERRGWSARLTKDAKDDARDAIAGRLPQLLSIMGEVRNAVDS
jgi:hypothetical protein